MTLTKTEDKVRAVMTRRVVTIKPDAPVRKALQAMIKKDVGSLLVVKNKEPDASLRALGNNVKRRERKREDGKHHRDIALAHMRFRTR